MYFYKIAFLKPSKNKINPSMIVIPALLDVVATVFANTGLIYTHVSIY